MLNSFAELNQIQYQGHILIVDDSPDNLRLLSRMIEAQGYFVRKALSGRLAIQSAERNPPDLILLDITMPEMNGYEVCRQLKVLPATAQIPIIFISALNQVEDKVRAFAMGGKDYITKPFQELEVLARVQNQLLVQQQRRQLEQEICDRQHMEAEVRRLNVDLEQQVQAHTVELQQSLKFELTLKRITDKVRDSLDPDQILQTAVTELAIALEVDYCDAILTAPAPSLPLHYQYHAPTSTMQLPDWMTLTAETDLIRPIPVSPEGCSFCPWTPEPPSEPLAILVSPIFDDQVAQSGTLGNLWLLKSALFSFSSMEVHLVQQVANQCAIALRQARLYAATQAQVDNLARLNQLKDDFLSTVSHELRTPIASMKMVLKLLMTVTSEGRNLMAEITQLSGNQNVPEYFRVLQEECDRELKLVEDLLSLQHMEAGNYASTLVALNLHTVIMHLVEPFESRAQRQQQTLQVQVSPNLPDVSVDLRILTRILTELLSNACKYTPAGGQIMVRADLLPDSQITSTLSLLQLLVLNTGVEIAATEQTQIFEKFYRIPNHDPWKYGGTGLGLALVKKLVEQMGGEIMVQSANQQTCFQVQWRLPDVSCEH